MLSLWQHLFFFEGGKWNLEVFFAEEPNTHGLRSTGLFLELSGLLREDAIWLTWNLMSFQNKTLASFHIFWTRRTMCLCKSASESQLPSHRFSQSSLLTSSWTNVGLGARWKSREGTVYAQWGFLTLFVCDLQCSDELTFLFIANSQPRSTWTWWVCINMFIVQEASRIPCTHASSSPPLPKVRLGTLLSGKWFCESKFF